MQASLAFPQNNKNDKVYPKRISYVHVLIKSNSGKADVDVVDGGIGEDMMRLNITAYNTQLFNYEIVVYGI